MVRASERRARLLQQALPQLSLYAGSALMVEPGMLFPSLTVVAMKAAANPRVLWTGPTGPASIVNSQCTTCIVFGIESICSLATIKKSFRRRKI